MVDISWSVASLLCCHRQIITLMHHHISHLPAWSLFIVVLVINILCKNLLCLLYINQQSWSEARPIEALIKLIKHITSNLFYIWSIHIWSKIRATVRKRHLKCILDKNQPYFESVRPRWNGAGMPLRDIWLVENNSVTLENSPIFHLLDKTRLPSRD